MFLDKLKKNESCTILEIPNQDILKSMGIRRGIPVKIIARQPFGGPVVVRSGGNCIAIDMNLAKVIKTTGAVQYVK